MYSLGGNEPFQWVAPTAGRFWFLLALPHLNSRPRSWILPGHGEEPTTISVFQEAKNPMTERVETGACFCGAIAAELRGDPFWICYDHDDDCRRAVGGPLNVWVGYRPDEFRLTRGAPKSFSKTKGVVRTFCPDCGTSIAYRDEGLDNELYVSIGFLDHPERFRASGPRLLGDEIALGEILRRSSEGGRLHATTRFRAWLSLETRSRLERHERGRLFQRHTLSAGMIWENRSMAPDFRAQKTPSAACAAPELRGARKTAVGPPTGSSRRF